MIAGLYEPLLQEAVRYDRTTYAFTAKGLIAAAAGTAGLVRNGGRTRLICDHTVRPDALQAIRDGQPQAEDALRQTHDAEDLLLTEPEDLSKDHIELAAWLVANGIMEVKVAIREPTIFHVKGDIVEDAEGNRAAFSGSLNETLSGWAANWENIIESNVKTYRDGRTEPADQPAWNTPLAIASQQWLVRNAEQFIETCGDYDLIICDEAHRARFRNVDAPRRRQFNQYLSLMNRLYRKTRELLLLTATPMQMNEMELWALFNLLNPDGWNTAEYQRFYQDGDPDLQEWKFRRDLWRKAAPGAAGNAVLNSENDDYVALRLNDLDVMQETLSTMEKSAPARRLMSRHTRQLLRRYRQQGFLDAPIPTRRVMDTVITLTAEERDLYEGITELAQQCYADSAITQQSLGFIMTVFRKRLGSSTYAYAQTLKNAANRRLEDSEDWMALTDDADLDDDDEAAVGALQRFTDLDALLRAADEAENLSGKDSKRHRLNQTIRELREKRHSHMLMFTQFRDTQT